jgi:allophanate hydrolase subunit 1
MRCYGSPGGAPMLDGPRFPRPVPRLASPRPHVPAGAVAVAGRQAVVSARPAPGGWCVIGRTPLTLVDVTRTPLAAFAPGDTFRFVPIAPHEWSAHEGVLDA